jgi:uncharacterized protein (UPF0333 family)
MKFITIILSFLLIVHFSSAQTNAQIVTIRKAVQLVNNEKAYDIKNITNEYFVDVKSEAADNGQNLTGYYKSGKLKKIVYKLGLSNCIKTYKYYFSD